ncbi:MAG: phage tail protein [Negativicutes bacterium]|nr:phage tail protein [Negativicutes bacterium]
MAYNANLPADTAAPAEIRENFRALKEDKIVAANTANMADKLSTARNISLTGDATGSALFDGTADVAITVDVTSADTAKSVAWDNVTGKPSTFPPPVATSSVLGGIKQGNGLSIAADGTASVVVSAIILPGAVQYFAMPTAPSGWLVADGSAVLRTEYAALFAAIGSTFGTGDGSTTFNLPDLRGEFVRGIDKGRGVDSGRVFGSEQADAVQGHGHNLLYQNTGSVGGALDVTLDTTAQTGILANKATDLISDGSNGTPRVAAETRPRNIALLACIKY